MDQSLPSHTFTLSLDFLHRIVSSYYQLTLTFSLNQCSLSRCLRISTFALIWCVMSR